MTLPSSLLPAMAGFGPVRSSVAGTFPFTLQGNQSLRWAAPVPHVTGVS
jgi:hypothetical protein